MKIGYVCKDTAHYSERFLWDEVRLLEKAGHEVIVFCKYHHPDNNIGVHAKIVKAHLIKRLLSFQAICFTLFLLWRVLRPAFKLYRLEREHKASMLTAWKRVYYSAHILPYRLDCLVFSFAPLVENRLWIAKAINTQMIVCLRGYDVNIKPQHLNQADKLFIRSMDLYHYALNSGLSKDIPYSIIPSAVDIQKIYFQPKIRQDNVVQILSVGRAHWKKGYEYTLLALQQLAKEGVPFRYTIIGSGAEEQKLLFMVKMLKLEDHVVFAGALSNAEVLPYLYASHLFIHSSISEGCSNVLLEAQAAGLFCIASDIPGNLIVHQETGLQYEKCNVSDLVKTIKIFLNMNEQEKKLILTRARLKIETDFSMERLLEHLRGFYLR